MRKVIDGALIVGFLAVDFFFFHDFFKPGEIITLPQYMTGILSVLVIAVATSSIVRSSRSV